MGLTDLRGKRRETERRADELIQHTQAAGSTSAQTFKVRGGMSWAGTCTFNGGGGARVLGAITKSSIVVEEWT